MHNLDKLRHSFTSLDLDGFIIPMSDPFQNDFIPAHYHRVQFLSCFSGSLGTIVALKNKAALFVDGRYTLQAQNQVDTRYYDIENYNAHSIACWIMRHGNQKKIRVGYDPWCYTAHDLKHLEELSDLVIFVPITPNPVDQLWGKAQPPIPCTDVFLHPDVFAGANWKQKVNLIRKTLSKNKVDSYFFCSSASVCWLLNIRAHDVPYTPTCLCYALLERNGKITVFLNLKGVSKKIRAHFGDEVIFRHLHSEEFPETLSRLVKEKRVGYSETQTPIFIESLLKKYAESVENLEDPSMLPRACKNKKQIQYIKDAHVMDGVALVRFYHWLDTNVEKTHITEKGASEKIDAFRYMNPHLKGLSFPTIAGTRKNASIVHYHAEDKCLTLKKGDLFLCDSGGQYFEGTTDVTRTVCIGKNPTLKQKTFFTAILKGLIDLQTIIFPEGTTGKQIDILARQYLWALGYDYAHATGHGVGQYSNVHEGPQSISPRSVNIHLEPGMVLSNEPGCYLGDDFGIRIENLMYVKDLKQKDSHGRNLFGFGYLTLCPIDTSCIDIKDMSPKHIDWINKYHQTVLRKIGPFLKGDVLGWLKAATQKI